MTELPLNHIPSWQRLASTETCQQHTDPRTPTFPSAPLEAFAATVGGANGTAAAAAAGVGAAGAAAGADAGASSSLLSSLGLRIEAEAAVPNLEAMQVCMGSWFKRVLLNVAEIGVGTIDNFLSSISRHIISGKTVQNISCAWWLGFTSLKVGFTQFNLINQSPVNLVVWLHNPKLSLQRKCTAWVFPEQWIWHPVPSAAKHQWVWTDFIVAK